MNALLAAALVVSSAAPLTVEPYNAGPAGFEVTSTLISGEKEAVLVDAQFTLADAHRVAARVLESGKTLKTIVITHGHPDHYFGLEVLTAAFPAAKVIASRKVVDEIAANAPASLAQWKPVFGNAITSSPVVPAVFDGEALELEGQRLELIPVVDAESPSATAVWIPSVKTLVAGDAVYDGVHAWLADANTQARRDAWVKDLEMLKALKPAVVIGGHRAPGAKGTPAVIDAQVKYLRDFSNAVKGSANADQVVRVVLERHALELPVILEIASKASVRR